MLKVFFSFDHQDIERAEVVRKSWVKDRKEDRVAYGFMEKSEFESIETEGDFFIEEWVEKQIYHSSVTVILFTQKVYKCPWVKHAIKKTIEKKNPIIGIDISQIKDSSGRTSTLTRTPQGYTFYLWFDNEGSKNIENWIERAFVNRRR